MSADTVYQPLYSNSRALVIGINQYVHASPLGYAVNDAEAFARCLTSQFDFADGHVLLLRDGDATGERVRQEFMAFTADEVGHRDCNSALQCA